MLFRSNANLGDKVKPGQSLAQLDSIELGDAHSTYRQAQSQLSLAKSDFERAQKLKADDITRIETGLSTMTHVHCAWEYKAQGVTAAQMNLFFGLAAIAIDGDAFVEQYRENRLRDPKILDFIKRIEASAEKEIDDMGALFRHAARLTVHTKDGRKIFKEVLHRLGSPENPASEDEVYRKFGILTRQCLSDAQRNELIALVRDLDKLEDLGKLTAILAAARVN